MITHFPRLQSQTWCQSPGTSFPSSVTLHRLHQHALTAVPLMTFWDSYQLLDSGGSVVTFPAGCSLCEVCAFLVCLLADALACQTLGIERVEANIGTCDGYLLCPGTAVHGPVCFFGRPVRREVTIPSSVTPPHSGSEYCISERYI